jgi:cyclophilin family peptidyl-prolyl cis-trans isomerase
MKHFLLAALLTTFSMFTHAEPAKPTAIMKTSKGDITIELFPNEAPVTVANFIEYAESGFYNGTIFHRVIPRFVIQGGGLTADMDRKQTRAPIINEGNNGLKNEFLTLSMARTNDPNSATSQFFINLTKNTNLDSSRGRPGYAVFARVIDGEYVVRDIAKQPTTTKGHFRDVPKETITIQSVDVIKPQSKAN